MNAKPKLKKGQYWCRKNRKVIDFLLSRQMIVKKIFEYLWWRWMRNKSGICINNNLENIRRQRVFSQDIISTEES